MTNDDSSSFPRRLQRGLTAAHFRSAALAMGFAAASAVAAVSFLGSDSALPLVPIVATASLAGLVLSARLFRRGAADLAAPLDRCERILDAMASGQLPETPSEIDCAGLENLNEAVSGLLWRMRALDAEIHAGAARLRILAAELGPVGQREVVAILDGIRNLAPTAGTTAEQPVPCWLMDGSDAPAVTPARHAASALDLLRLDDPEAGIGLGPGWEFQAKVADELAAA